ncbi:hypothetical protein NIES39_E00010 [Arthrospira platensis NIES-39]|nr:hypothetical protein NIES39_E00010 [Arthrospira platensis NIES-39]
MTSLSSSSKSLSEPNRWSSSALISSCMAPVTLRGSFTPPAFNSVRIALVTRLSVAISEYVR